MDGVTERQARQEAAAGQDAGRGGTAHADQLYGEILGILNINGPTAAELDAELDRKVAIHAKARDAVTELVPLAERDASRRGELFGAIRRSVALSEPKGLRDADHVVLMVTVLLDAGRPVELSEVSRRMRERWGEHTTESALYSAKSSGAISHWWSFLVGSGDLTCYTNCNSIVHMSTCYYCCHNIHFLLMIK